MMQLTTLGIDYARTVQSHGDFRPPANFMTWHPTCHHNHGLMDLLERFKVNSPWNRMPLFYVWGHSYEFNRENNWDLMEEFCKRASHDDSVWYATNIELYDYFQGLRSLRFSVDRKMIFNPSGFLFGWMSMVRLLKSSRWKHSQSVVRRGCLFVHL
jgi:hypothetical protein